MVPKQPVTTLAKYDDMVKAQDKFSSSNNTRPESSVVKTISECRHSGAAQRAEPESISTIVSEHFCVRDKTALSFNMDSQLALCAPRNDGYRANRSAA